MLRYCANLKAIKYESTSLKRIVADKSRVQLQLNLIETVGKVELISTSTAGVYESWNVSEKYTLDNAGDHKQLSMDQTFSKDDRSD